MSHGRTCALECKVSKIAAECVLYAFCKRFDALMILEVDGLGRAHFLRECKAFFFAVDRNDIFDTHRSENGDTDKTDRTATLNNDAGVEAENACCFCSFHSVDQNCARLDEDSGIEIEVAYVEYGGAASYEDIIGEPAVEVNVIVGKKTVYVCAADVLFVKVIHGDVGIVLEDHTSNNLITDGKGLACAVLLYVLTHLDDLACAFMTEGNGDKTKGVTLKFMRVSTANAAAFDLDENVIVADFGNGVFLDFKFFELCEHCNLSGLGEFARSRRSSGNGCRLHVRKNLLHNFLDIGSIHIHNT